MQLRKTPKKTSLKNYNIKSTLENSDVIIKATTEKKHLFSKGFRN